MNYKEACDYHEHLKTYGSELGLASMSLLMQELSDVQNKLKIIHVAGTNGKGSVCSMISSILTEAGYRTGRFHSPAVFEEREVFLIDGNCILEQEYAECMTVMKHACRRVTDKGGKHPTVFEVDTALAFYWFYTSGCAFVVLETGLGGEMDATNIAEQALACVFTSISMDHMEYLGTTLTSIAGIKSGIIKPETTVITGRQEPEVAEVLEQKADKMRSAFLTAEPGLETVGENDLSCTQKGVLFCHGERTDLFLPTVARYQLDNAGIALTVIDFIKNKGFFIKEEAIRNGLKKLDWQGRMELLQKEPELYIDGAHNAGAAVRLKETLALISGQDSWIMIMGVMKDKEYQKIIEQLSPFAKEFYTVAPEQNDRALDPEILASVLRKQTEKPVFATGAVRVAVEQAINRTKQLNLQSETASKYRILAFGSLYYLKEVKRAVNEIRQKELQ